MTKITKVVKFYEPLLFDKNDEVVPTNSQFWTELHAYLTGVRALDREFAVNGTTYAGEARVATAPAEKYLYVGRLRPAGDAPDNYRPGVGVTGPAATSGPGDQFSEPTLLLPFGTRNYVAIMSPRHGSTRVETLGAWISGVGLDLASTGYRFELSPLVDQRVLEKLAVADGASKLYVRVPPSAEIPKTGGGDLGEALRRAAESAPPGTYVDIAWSFGRARGSDGGRQQLLRAARWLSRGHWTERAEVSLQLPDGEGGLRSEVHELFRDRITLRTSFEVDAASVPSEEAVLRAMLRAVDDFRRRA